MDTGGLIQRLFAENEVLRERCILLEQQNAALRQQLTVVGEQVTELQVQLSAAEELVGELERAKQRPPSFVKPNKPKGAGPRQPRRKRAKQHNRGRPRAAEITRREEHRIERCPECDTKLRKQREAWRREVIELPPPQRVEVTEHVVYKGYCPRCEQWRCAVPCAPGTVVGQRRFGARLTALVGYLTEGLRLPLTMTKDYLATLHGVEVSIGALVDLRDGLARCVQPEVERLYAEVRNSAIVHAD